MTDFKDDEYRTLKYLRSSPEYVEYFKRHAASIKRIGHGKWENIEFIEDLIENQNKTLYIVSPGSIHLNGTGEIPNFDVEQSNFQIIRNYKLLIHDGTKSMFSSIDKNPYRIATSNDVSSIEYNYGRGCLISNTSFIDIAAHNESVVLGNSPVISRMYNDLYEYFYKKEEAKDYAIALREYLYNNSKNISTFV